MRQYRYHRCDHDPPENISYKPARKLPAVRSPEKMKSSIVKISPKITVARIILFIYLLKRYDMVIFFCGFKSSIPDIIIKHGTPHFRQLTTDLYATSAASLFTKLYFAIPDVSTWINIIPIHAIVLM